MKTILLPNDLSAAAENAFAYAVEFALAQPEKTNLIVLHVFDSALTYPMNTFDLIALDTEAEEQEAKAALEKMVARHVRATGLSCSIVTVRGYLEDSICRAAAAYKADYIFMGTKGASGLKAWFVGSNASAVIERANCPVLAIPEKAFFVPKSAYVFASDFADEDLTEAAQVVELARKFSAKVVLLHVSEKEEEELDLRVLDFLRAKLQQQTGYAHVETASVYSASFADGLAQELTNQRGGVLVMAPRRRSFLQGLVSPSRTRQMVLKTAVPLLAMPKVPARQTEPVTPESLTENSFL